MHVEFTKASEAANRAVMAETDDAAAAAATEARQARQVVERDADGLRALITSLGYRDDIRDLEGFTSRFDEYRRLDDEILTLAVENTNVKAQRLSFGPAREAAGAFRLALDGARQAGGGRDPWRAEALAGRALRALLEIQVLHASHIAEADPAAMDRMEEQMAAAEKRARAAVQELEATLTPEAARPLADAIAALDRFAAISHQLVSLSRRNSDVHSLALSLGRKRTVAAECEDQLQALEEALARHEFIATR